MISVRPWRRTTLDPGLSFNDRSEVLTFIVPSSFDVASDVLREGNGELRPGISDAPLVACLRAVRRVRSGSMISPMNL